MIVTRRKCLLSTCAVARPGHARRRARWRGRGIDWLLVIPRTTAYRARYVAASGEFPQSVHLPVRRGTARPRRGTPARPARCSVRMWLRLLSRTSRLSGISAASSRAWDSGTRRSPREWTISVGHRTLGARCDTSMRANTSRNLTTLSIDVVARCRSLNAPTARGCRREGTGWRTPGGTCRRRAATRPGRRRGRGRPRRSSPRRRGPHEPAAAVGTGEDQAARPARGDARRRRWRPPPPWDIPSSGNRSTPTASTTSSRSSTQASKLKSATSQSDSPQPRSS